MSYDGGKKFKELGFKDIAHKRKPFKESVMSEQIDDLFQHLSTLNSVQQVTK